jgi:hypothetical protein
VISPRVEEVQDQLRRRAYARREEFSAVLSWFVAEGVALRLAQHVEVRDQLPLCGALMLHASLGGEAPFEWRAELLAAGPVSADDFEKRFRAACGVEVDDGLVLELPVGGVGGPIEMEGGRCLVLDLVGRLGSIGLSLPVVVWIDEQFRGRACDYLLQSVIGGSLRARVLACSPTALVALRLRAAVCVGAAPTGMNVLWDLYRLTASGQIDGTLVPDAVADAFRDRVVPLPKSVPLLLSEEFAADASRQRVWAAFLKRARVDAPVLSEVVRRVQREAWPWLVQGAARL